MNAPAQEHLESFEAKLRDRDATLDGALRWIDRHLHRQPELRRIELRFPSRSARPIAAAEARSRIAALCQQKGLVTGVAVSARAHELPLDNDAGHLTVRLLFAVQESKLSENSGDGFLSRLRRLFGLDDDHVADEGKGVVDPMAQRAVDTLLRGMDEAAARFKAIQTEMAVSTVLISVNAPELHQALAPKMPPADVSNANLWLARELADRGLVPDAQLQVCYRFLAPVSDSTDLVTEGDLSVRLVPPSATDELVSAVTHSTQESPTDTPLPQTGGDTPLPVSDPKPSPAVPAVHLRVLGTWRDGALVPLTEPFTCNLGPVPALFSRSTLELHGFTRRADAGLARAASNSTPLGFANDGQGGIKLHAAQRSGSTLAMYFFAADLKPCSGEHPLSGPLRLVVNGPAPLQDGLFPMVIEVSPGG